MKIKWIIYTLIAGGSVFLTSGASGQNREAHQEGDGWIDSLAIAYRNDYVAHLKMQRFLKADRAPEAKDKRKEIITIEAIKSQNTGQPADNVSESRKAERLEKRAQVLRKRAYDHEMKAAKIRRQSRGNSRVDTR